MRLSRARWSVTDVGRSIRVSLLGTLMDGEEVRLENAEFYIDIRHANWLLDWRIQRAKRYLLKHTWTTLGHCGPLGCVVTKQQAVSLPAAYRRMAKEVTGEAVDVP